MNEYHKINSIYMRSEDGRQVLWGQYSRPEFAFLRDATWVWTEKVDGTNIRVAWDGTQVRIRGRSDHSQTPDKLREALTELFPAEIFRDLGPMTLYGEGYGAGVQKGGAYRPDLSFALFDIKVGEHLWLRREDVEGIGERLHIDVVPIVGAGSLNDLEHYVEGGFKSKWGTAMAEGIVARPLVELRARTGERIITKLKARDFAGGKK